MTPDERTGGLSAEADHRIKNNLALVASMLSAQARETGIGPLADGLNEAKARILAIASLHETLSEDQLTDDVDLADYLGTVCARMEDAGVLSERVSFVRHLDSRVRLGASDASRVGLVVAELVTNASQHAFGPTGIGTLTLTLFERGDGLVVCVQDDGTGPEDTSTRGTGSTILASVVRKLGGHLRTEKRDGCRAELFVLRTVLRPDTPLDRRVTTPRSIAF